MLSVIKHDKLSYWWLNSVNRNRYCGAALSNRKLIYDMKPVCWIYASNPWKRDLLSFCIIDCSNSVFIRILEDDIEESVPTPKTQMLAINVWPTTHRVKKQKSKNLQQLCCRAKCKNERSRLEQPSKSNILSPPQQQNMTICQEKLLGSPETTGPANQDP